MSQVFMSMNIKPLPGKIWFSKFSLYWYSEIFQAFHWTEHFAEERKRSTNSYFRFYQSSWWTTGLSKFQGPNHSRCLLCHLSWAEWSGWWDTAQLLEHIKNPISIFEQVHPDCVALFVFDQSPNHASLGPDALRAFEMNKGDGGKQQKQRDTVIPQSNPTSDLCRKVQKMTLPDGKPKGLEHVLTEHGFDIQGMHAKCSPVCPFENDHCCMAQLLSKQDDFAN